MTIDNPLIIKGHIYKITNIICNKSYIGQAVSHRKNKNKYIPFGYIGRFNDHISEAICNTKAKQCSYLNNAIRIYGKEAFTVNLIVECEKTQMDDLEKKYIIEYNTLYPNGYNLTNGGKGARFIKTSETINASTLNSITKRGGCKYRSKATRDKMSCSLKQTFNNPEVKQYLMLRAQNQHLDKKLERFKGVCININNIDDYIYERKHKNTKYILVKIGKLKASFHGKYDSIEEQKMRAIEFLKTIYSATLPNCSGNP
jgi:hypothetical protein